MGSPPIEEEAATLRTGARRGRPEESNRTPVDDSHQELWIPAEAGQLQAARGFIDAAARTFGFGDEGCRAITLAANEALANAVEHGSPCLGGKIRLRAWEEAGALAIDVCDCGVFMPSTDRSDEEFPERGRGLALIAALMDELHVSDDDDEGTTVRFAKRLG